MILESTNIYPDWLTLILLLNAMGVTIIHFITTSSGGIFSFVSLAINTSRLPEVLKSLLTCSKCVGGWFLIVVLVFFKCNLWFLFPSVALVFLTGLELERRYDRL